MNSRWGIPVPLLPGELFSSWLTRAALIQGCDPLVLTGEMWGKWRVWTIDPDRGLDAEKLKLLCSVSGIAEKVFEASMLHPIARVISSDVGNGKAVWPWMLALGSRNRKRHGGLQYCPACMADDRIPYYRLNWRLAWHTCCVRHECQLLDRCSYCHAPIEPHRLVAMDVHMAICASCKSDLRKAESSDANLDALAFQNAADYVITWLVGCYGLEHVVSFEWFTLARYFMGLLRKVAMGKPERLTTMMVSLGVDTDALMAPATGLALELLPVNERALLFAGVWKVLVAGPDEFLRSAQEASVSVQMLKEPRQTLPACLEKLVEALPNKGKATRDRKASEISIKPRSPQSVMRMWARLQRKMRVVP